MKNLRRLIATIVITNVALTAGLANEVARSLFNGMDLDGWQGMQGEAKNWEVKDGVLFCTGGKGAEWLATTSEYADFDLTLEVKLPTDGNSGVFIRAPKEGVPYVDGIEIQLLDDAGPKWKDLKPDQFTGAIYAVLAPSKRATKPAGHWQTLRILCVGPKCRVWVNSELIVDADLEKLAAKHGDKVPGLKRDRGLIGLQNHGDPVSFRNIRVSTVSVAANAIAPDVAAMDKARMDAAVKFAETVLAHGRDHYGEKHTPLFTDSLEVDTMIAPERIYIPRLGKPGPRQHQPFQPVVSANLSFQGNLMRFLAGISKLTGDPTYNEAYKDCIRYYFQHYQAENGLVQMGHHRFVNLKTDQYDGNDWPAGASGHEVKGDYPYYDLFWETDPMAAGRMLAGHWNTHIKNWESLDFTRHGSYGKKISLDEGVWGRPFSAPVQGIVKGDLTFFDSGSDIIWAGGKLAQLDGDDRPLSWAKRLFARYADSAHPETGLPPWHHTMQRSFKIEGDNVPEFATLSAAPADALFGNGATAMLRLSEKFGENGRSFAEAVNRFLKAYAKYAYDPEDNTLRYILYDGRDMSATDRQRAAAQGMIWKAQANHMISFALCYRLSGDKEIWNTLRAICRGNDLGDIGDAGGKAPELNLATQKSDPNIIFALIEIFRASNDKAYLELARVIGNNVVKQQFIASKGLFAPSELHRVANLNDSAPLALITLEAALRGQLDRVPTYDGSTPGDVPGYLRPTRALPYHPTASSCTYSDTVLALCDELTPSKSNDSSIPVMTWQNPRSDKGRVVAIFPDILKGPVTISGMNENGDAKNWVSGIVIDSPVSYAFADGGLNGAGDFTVTVLQGDHRWQAGSWTPTSWSPTGSFDFIMDIAAGARFTLGAALFEYSDAWHNGAGLIKDGDGVAVVTADYAPRYSTTPGDNRAYRQPTLVNAGVLLVNNATGSGTSPRSTVEVRNRGTLGGNGAFGNGGTWAIVTVHEGGTIAPGDGVGTLTFRDGLTLKDGANLAFDLGTSADLIKVTGGTFTSSGKGGIALSIADSGGLEVGKTYDLIDWSGAALRGIEADDFVVDAAAPYKGKFQISGNKLQITISAITVSASLDNKPSSSEGSAKAVVKPMTTATYTWTNPDGGNWMDSVNWQEDAVPNGKQMEWVQYDFKRPRTISSVEVYWLDDQGGRRVPESWRVLYRHADEWRPVEAAGAYGVETDKFNEVRFKAIETAALRLEAMPQPGMTSGILEWRVSP